MAYVKQNFVKGQILTAEHMNHIEDGIVAAADAQSLGGVAAGSYALKTDVAPDSTMLGGKAPAYYLQPRNLLDNSDFTNPVNQRGQTSYQTPWSMTIDRWYLSSYAENNATLTLTTNGVVITPGTSGIAAIAQRLPSEDLHADKAYTALAQTLDGTYITGTVENHTDTYGFYQIGFKVSAETTLVWAALYEGSYDVSTLPPYVPKENEIISCREYYREYGDDGIYCYCYTNDYLTGFDFDIPMRIAPSILECSILRLNGFESMNVGASSIMTAKGVTYIHCPGAVAGEWYRITNLKLSADL